MTEKPDQTAHSPDAETRARRISLLAFDVDGTLTDGRIYIGSDGEAFKAFSVRDGLGLSLLRRAGLRCALITARRSSIVARRAAELKIEEVIQGVEDKGEALEALAERAGIELDRVAFMGDDWPDIPAMRRAGLAAAPLDAPAEIRDRAHWVSSLPAGAGAARELAEFVLRSQGLWTALLEAQDQL